MSDGAADLIANETHWYGGGVTSDRSKALELDNFLRTEQDTAVKLLEMMWAAGRARPTLTGTTSGEKTIQMIR
ncbi:hypothetical protein ACIBQ1_59295 [Nonomuraea sp. NPDC050153]|uniref:hypothetical protein n=1 Tax=Nonomuraea sp. NPDC050153 TaxID=3364359 RepID=UPI00379EDF1F